MTMHHASNIALLLLPLLLAGIVTAATRGKGRWWTMARWISAFTMHPDQGLVRQGLLWLSILVPLFYGLGAGIIIWADYQISLTQEGLETFVKISAIPLALFSLSLPLTILVSRLHATSQTANQITLTRHKNNIDSFYSHRKELFSYFAQIGEVVFLDCIIAKFKLHPRIHKRFFTGKLADGTPMANEAEFKTVESDIENALWKIHGVLTDFNPEMTYSLYVANLCSEIYRLALTLGLTEIYIVLAEKSTLVPAIIDEEPKMLRTVGTTTTELIAAFRYIYSFFHNLCDFAGITPLDSRKDPAYRYIFEGGAFHNITIPPVIERLHAEDIRKNIDNYNFSRLMEKQNSANR
ncbi:hypothetical protein HF257_10885 [Pseudomonas sp. WS 5106]|uniref:Uncharacterized protein n=1 Tax=Pseudomonas cremoris TaxID=2724178 RepID=A0A7X1DYH5_9PSED|nr:hypothetical protein [Pseudomonas cremoris]MBC2381716.1 hypothetical protein [Pseudomonas cremoris]MBC2405873.1 hypothetical protein [Pseudomonas cremoris]MBC2406509.1 hypothetical protein [Pseudomonas cremoris]